MDHFGTLYIVATPIGNLKDLSPRAVETLQSVDVVLAEDTRRFSKLATAFSISTKTISYHDHNELARSQEVLEKIKLGKSVALVSDAGTPLVSDPGYRLLRACIDEGVPVSTIPGPCAAIAALTVSGFEPNRFLVEGFLPQKKGKRKKRLAELLEMEMTTIVYESPYRILATVKDIAEQSPQRALCIGRELTKLYEEILRGTAEELATELSSRKKILGELVLVIRPSGKSATLEED